MSTIPCLISANFLHEIYDYTQSESEKEDKDETDTKEDGKVQFPNKVVPDPVFLV